MVQFYLLWTDLKQLDLIRPNYSSLLNTKKDKQMSKLVTKFQKWATTKQQHDKLLEAESKLAYA